jgi:hypothetical protein
VNENWLCFCSFQNHRIHRIHLSQKSLSHICLSTNWLCFLNLYSVSCIQYSCYKLALSRLEPDRKIFQISAYLSNIFDPCRASDCHRALREHREKRPINGYVLRIKIFSHLSLFGTLDLVFRIYFLMPSSAFLNLSSMFFD